MTLLEKAARVLGIAYGGEHNIPGQVKNRTNYIEVNVPGGIATWDGDVLTRLVLGAHDYCVRLEITDSGPGLIRLLFHDRDRGGDLPIVRRHPAIQEAIKCYRRLS